jgi:hypothetical protein
MENAIWIAAADGGLHFNIDFINWVEDDGSYGTAEGETVDGELVKGRISVEDIIRVRRHNSQLVKDGVRKRVRTLREQEMKRKLFRWLKPTGGCS